MLAGLIAAMPAQAQSLHFELPAEPAVKSIPQFAIQAQVQIVAPADQLAGIVTPALSGDYDRRAALVRLLQGTPLTVASDDGRTVVLRGAAPTPEMHTPAQAAYDTGVVDTVETVVVTAQQRSQRAVDVPFALTAYSGKTLEQMGAATLRDVSVMTPGLLVEDQSPNNPIFVMRGVTSSGGDAFTEPRVAVFQDGVPISKSRGSFVELYDIDRVEVAKGPQSTLYGRGALIGGINVIQNRATPDFSYALAAEGGNLDYKMVDGMINIPLDEDVSLRLAARHRERGGDVKNLDPNAKGDLNDIDLSAARATLSYAPSEKFRADLIVNGQRDKTDGTGFKSMYMSPTNPATGAVLAGTANGDPVWLSSPADFANGRSLGVDQSYWGVTGLLQYQFSPALTLHSISSYRDVGAREVYDADGTSLPLYTVQENDGGNFVSQELRLAYDDGGAVSWFAGGSFYRERAHSDVDIRFDERMLLAQVAGMLNGGPFTGLPATTPAPESLFGNTGFTGALVQGLVAQQSAGQILLSGADAMALAAQLDPAHVEHQRNTADLDSYDLFGDVTWHPGEHWEFSAGLRYSTDNKVTRWASSVDARSILGGIVGASGLAASGTPTGVGTGKALLAGLTAYGTSLAAPLPAFAINTQPTANNGDFVAEKLSDSGLTWRLTGRYLLSDGANLYANYARGRRPAVLSAAAPSAPGGTPIFTVAPAEIVDAYEVGYKLATSSISFDAAVFYYDYQNFQTRELVGSAFVTSNAGEARSYGVELQGYWRVNETFDLFGTYAFTHARFDNGAYKGNHFARSPDHMASIGASLNLPGLGGMFHVRPSYSYRSKIFFADDNDVPALQKGRIVPDLIQDEYQNGFGLLNLRLNYAPDAASWELEAFVDNALDKVYRKGAGSAGESIGLPTNVRGEPRVYGLRFAIHD